MNLFFLLPSGWEVNGRWLHYSANHLVKSAEKLVLARPYDDTCCIVPWKLHRLIVPYLFVLYSAVSCRIRVPCCGSCILFCRTVPSRIVPYCARVVRVVGMVSYLIVLYHTVSHCIVSYFIHLQTRIAVLSRAALPPVISLKQHVVCSNTRSLSWSKTQSRLGEPGPLKRDVCMGASSCSAGKLFEFQKCQALGFQYKKKPFKMNCGTIQRVCPEMITASLHCKSPGTHPRSWLSRWAPRARVSLLSLNEMPRRWLEHHRRAARSTPSLLLPPPHSPPAHADQVRPVFRCNLDLPRNTVEGLGQNSKGPITRAGSLPRACPGVHHPQSRSRDERLA